MQRQANQLLPQLLIEQFDTLPIQCRHIEHIHLILCLYNVDTLNVRMKDFISKKKMTAMRT